MNADLIMSSLDDLKEGQKVLIKTVEQLARVEERQMAATKDLERVQIEVKEVERRVDSLEKAAPATSRVVEWADRAAWASLAAVGVYVMKALGFL